MYEYNILIRRLTVNDLQHINHIQSMRGFNYVHASFIQSNMWVLYGAFINTKLVAICGFFKYYRIPHSDYPNGCVVELGGAYTLPEYRNRGIMSKLVDEMFDHFKEDIENCDAIVADASDLAYPLYKKKGCIDSDEHRIWWPLNY